MYEGLDGETVNSSSACDVLSQQTIDELNNMLSDSGVKLNNDISETSVKELINQLAEIIVLILIIFRKLSIQEASERFFML